MLIAPEATCSSNAALNATIKESASDAGTHHVRAGTCECHELGVELQAGDRPCMLSI